MAPKKILAIKLRALGDTVLMTAPLAELRLAFPHSKVDVAVTSTWAPLLEGHPAVDRIWKYERHEDRAARAKSIARLAFRLRKERYDCVVNFHASPSSALLSFATGAGIRSIHFHGHRDSNRHTTVQVPGKGTLKPIIERDMDAIRALGVHVPAGRMPRIQLHPAELKWAEGSITHMGLKGPILGLGLGSSRPTKSWPIERFAALAVEWCRKEGGGVFAVAGPAEESFTRAFLKAVDDLLVGSVQSSEIRAQIRTQIVANHGLKLREIAALMSRFSVFAANDSGPRHIAVAVDCPTVTLFGPEHPFEWHPYPIEKNPFFFIDNLACRRDAQPGMPAWCALHECVIEHHKCMNQIGVDPVLLECQRLRTLARTPK